MRLTNDIAGAWAKVPADGFVPGLLDGSKNYRDVLASYVLCRSLEEAVVHWGSVCDESFWRAKLQAPM